MPAQPDQNDRRPAVRRTVVLLTTVAVLLYGMFFIRALLS